MPTSLAQQTKNEIKDKAALVYLIMAIAVITAGDIFKNWKYARNHALQFEIPVILIALYVIYSVARRHIKARSIPGILSFITVLCCLVVIIRDVISVFMALSIIEVLSK